MNAASSWEVPADLEDKIRSRVTSGLVPEVLILPSVRRSGETYYSEDDADAVKIARQADVPAEYLDEASTRRFLAEHGADLVLEVAVGVMANLGTSGLVALGRYISARIVGARFAGTLVKSKGMIDVSIAEIDIRPDGVNIKGLHVRAEAEGAGETVIRALASATDAAKAITALREDRPEGPS